MKPVQPDILPGMPDALAKKPPKAVEYEGLTLDEAIAKAHALVDEALERANPDHVFILYSGGEDSVILAHLMRRRATGIVHINTGTGVPETAQHVRDIAAAWGVPLHEIQPPDTFEDLVLGKVLYKNGAKAGTPVWKGFPGPGAHDKMYQRLKERALDDFRRSLVGPRGRAGQIVNLAGMRWAESDKRFRTASEFDPDGAILWCSPIAWWTEGHMREYRVRYRCQLDHEHEPHLLCTPDALPRNEVTVHLHRSGDCHCGAYARAGEIYGLELFYPGTAAYLHDIEAKARAQGDIPVERCTWGWGPNAEKPSGAGRLCSSCPIPVPDGQDALFDMGDAA